MADDVEMELVRIEIHEKRDRQLIQLKEKGGERSFQIVIGYGEAAEIHRKLTRTPAPRPMTHDLCGSLLTATGATITKVVVSDLVDSTYYARICLDLGDGREAELDARPSDAIALSVQFQAPIHVATKVLDKLEPGV
ncbi:MAG: bifunctional nuclease family protein [Planctomycetota bacterium]